jgi:hypothetical protein
MSTSKAKHQFDMSAVHVAKTRNPALQAGPRVSRFGDQIHVLVRFSLPEGESCLRICKIGIRKIGICKIKASQ